MRGVVVVCAVQIDFQKEAEAFLTERGRPLGLTVLIVEAMTRGALVATTQQVEHLKETVKRVRALRREADRPH